MPRYFMQGTRLAWAERMMMDPSRTPVNITDTPKKQLPKNLQRIPQPSARKPREDSV